MRNAALKRAIDKAKRAQLDDAGGYSAVEREARALDREVGDGPFVSDADRRRIAELEAENRKLKGSLRNQRKRAELWRDRCMNARDHIGVLEARLAPPRPKRGKWHEEAVAMRDAGLSYPEIARALNVPDHSSVIYACTQSVYARKLRSVA